MVSLRSFPRPLCHSERLRESRKYLFFKQIKGKKHWIPNQVGDDIGVVFGDDIGMVIRDDSYYGFPIKDFGNDSYCGSSIKDLGMTVAVIPAKAGIQEVFLLFWT